MQQKTISRDTPLSEVTLRRYEKPSNLSERELVRKLCLSIGLLQPGDSRDILVDVLYVLLKAKKENKHLTSDEVEKLVIETRKTMKMPLVGIASSNIRRHLKRLKDIYIIDRHADRYRINENATLSELFDEKIEKFLIPSMTSRIKEYFQKVDDAFK